MSLYRKRPRRRVPRNDESLPPAATTMRLRGSEALVIDVTDDPLWKHFLDLVAIAQANGRCVKDEPLSLAHVDHFWALGEPVRVWRVVEWC
jgi:hypothetical protein